MPDNNEPFWMNAKFEGKCWECFEPIDVGDRMVWDAKEYRSYCKGCGEDVVGEPDPKPWRKN